MRLPLIPIMSVLILGLLVDWYIYRAVRQRCRYHKSLWSGVARWNGVLFAAGLLAIIAAPKKDGSDLSLRLLMWGIFAYASVYVPKIIYVLCDLLGRIPQLFRRRRLRWPGRIGAAMGVFLFAALWWGALVNRFCLDVNTVRFESAELPAGFDGLRMVQISDFHTGTYGTDTAFVAKVVDRINSLDPDVVVFTGDIVNRRSEELEPFVGVLSRLKARHGVYSILGNHDYGDYYHWPTPEAKAANLQLLKDMQARMGWKMLNNASATLYSGADSLVLIGVENIGDPPFAVYGDLDVAYPAVDDAAFKVLLSHNPAHWTEDIKDAPDKNIALTLSGHTHAMQTEIFGWSPAVFRYPTWGGMYSDGEGHSLYVNIGLGEVGFPARIGATPEITLFDFVRKQ